MMFLRHLLFLLLSLAPLSFTHPVETDSTLTVPRLERRGSCINGGTRACITYFGAQHCSNPLGSYYPTCNGNCFQYDSYKSLDIKGSLAYSTKCVMYSDIGCTKQIGDSGDVFNDMCLSPGQKAKSMKCYFNC